MALDRLCRNVLRKKNTYPFNKGEREMPIACNTNIGIIVRDFVKPIIQALTVELKHYRMRLLTTKCLNTSVTFWHLLFGKRGHTDTMYCDVANVVERHERQRSDSNPQIISSLKDDILDTKDKTTRFAYYVMLTDGYFVNDRTDKKEFFPGHVFVIEKVPDSITPYYYIYQSYINEYDFKGSMDFRQEPKIPAAKMMVYMECLEYFASNSVWDDVMIAFWQDLTNVDTRSMLGCRPQNAFHMCFRKKPITECLDNMGRFVDHILETIPDGKDSNVYGESNTEYNSRQQPLTNREMRMSFLALKEVLDHT